MKATPRPEADRLNAREQVRARIRELIRNPHEATKASADELLELCRDHRAAFAGEYLLSWPAASGVDRLFRRTSEEFKAMRIKPARACLLCIHDLIELPGESQAYFRMLGLSMAGGARFAFTDAETRWCDVNFDRLHALDGGSRGIETLKERHSYVGRSMTYAVNVVSGRIPAGKFVRLACQRQLDDLRRSGDLPKWVKLEA
ncbi:MAG: hypothetical protein ACE141_14400 [Bryobacteraceae bacterium]